MSTKNDGTLVRRVSFSNRVSYSDDASTTTVTTDDELYQDDGSFTDSEDDKSFCDHDSVESETEAVTDEEDDLEDDLVEDDKTEDYKGEDNDLGEETESEDQEEEENEEDDDDTMMEETVEVTSDDKANESTESGTKVSSELWDKVDDDEPPLVIRDGFFLPQRPSDFLGGYGGENATSSGHKVKLRKSWVADAKDAEEEHANPIPVTYSQFEEWKKSRVTNTPTFRKKKENAEAKANAALSTEEDQKATSKPKKESKSSSNVAAVANKAPRDSEVADKREPTAKGASPKSTEPSTKAGNSDTVGNKERPKGIISETGGSEMSSSDAAVSKCAAGEQTKSTGKSPKPALKTGRSARSSSKEGTKPAPVVKKPPKKDPESEAHEKEIAQLKDHVTKLQRKYDVIEVRTISQLADLEEETTKRMREYRSKADDLARKKRAKEEKRGLKEKAMKSQDLIEHLRRSNQKLRREGIKMKKEVEELKEMNQQLEEQNSIYGDYAGQCRSFEEVEVKLAEELNHALNKEMPKYEKLLRGMEEGVSDRAKSGQSERKAKEMYQDCMQSILEMLENDCTDDSLIDKVADIIEEESSDEDTRMDASSQDEQSIAEPEPENVKPARRKSSIKSASPTKTKPAAPSSPKKSSKRPSGILKNKTNSEDENAAPGPTKTTVRRSSSTGVKLAGRRGSSEKTKARPRRSSSSSFRSTRAPRKTAAKVVSDNDDSSICSGTSFQSETYSLSEYV
ncbi:expressed unknown protein [Seminavis robusta]|uniref:Uncharacterized protein n=1 Tax=Seminavis robusta TaxID=568900 RepID=A0A9N8DB10_9STRA|nr:expressed unknown protein [Seminavis robusta]|eukprot:Sro40_g024750.1 n/a (738) ;mRNA; f:92890-95181